MEEQMSVTEIIRLLCSEFDNVSNTTIAKYETLFAPLVSKKKFGNLYNQALALFICHKMKLMGLGENGALGEMGSVVNGFAVASVSDGGSSISYASAGQQNLTSDAEFALTVYGTQYLQLRKTVIVPISIVGGMFD